MINILKNGIITNSGPDQEWLDKHIAMGTFGEDYTVEIIDDSAKKAQEKINDEALAFLNKTDYLIIRETETGLLCPEEIKVQRQAARDSIVKL